MTGATRQVQRVDGLSVQWGQGVCEEGPGTHSAWARRGSDGRLCAGRPDQTGDSEVAVCPSLPSTGDHAAPGSHDTKKCVCACVCIRVYGTFHELSSR